MNVANASASSGSSQYVAGSRLRLASSDANLKDAASPVEFAKAAFVVAAAGAFTASSFSSATTSLTCLKISRDPAMRLLPRSSTRSPICSHLSCTAPPIASKSAADAADDDAFVSCAVLCSVVSCASSLSLADGAMTVSRLEITFCPSCMVSTANALRSAAIAPRIDPCWNTFVKLPKPAENPTLKESPPP